MTAKHTTQADMARILGLGSGARVRAYETHAKSNRPIGQQVGRLYRLIQQYPHLAAELEAMGEVAITPEEAKAIRLGLRLNQDGGRNE